MASDFDEFFVDARAAQFDVLGQSETYIGDDGQQPVTIIPGAEGSELLQSDDGRETYRHRPVELLTSDVSRPKRTHTVTVDGETWMVHQVESIRNGIAVVRMIIPVRVVSEGRRIQK